MQKNLKKNIKLFFNKNWLLLVSIFLFGYFFYNFINGQNGVIHYIKQKAKLEKLEAELKEVEEKRDSLQNKAHKLYPNSLDADLLDEQYRRTTGKIENNEVIYYYDNDSLKK
jgi:cell division protein FtsB